MRSTSSPLDPPPGTQLPSLSTGYQDLPLVQRKKLWRSFIRYNRRSYTELERLQANEILGELLNELLIKLTPANGPQIKIAAFMPTATEPGYGTLVETLSTGSWQNASPTPEILLPITLPQGVLRWAPYRSKEFLIPGPMGILEPDSSRSASSEVLATRDIIIVPALGVNARGQRLGQGGGYYDRALSQLPHPTPTLITLLFDGELHPDIPVEAHDEYTDYVITPKGTFRPHPNV